MGVHGTFCQLCGLPVQHDHYVRTAGTMLKIYRGARPNGGHTWEGNERPFPFTPEHAWLKQAVVLPWDEERVIRGPVEDGAIQDERGESVLVFEGGEDGLTFHEACWELQGRPGSTGPAVRANGTHAWALLEPYHEQLFDFDGLEGDGKSWTLADPRRDPRSRARVEAMLAIARDEVTEPGKSIEEILKHDRDWAAVATRDEGGRRVLLIRSRIYTIENVPKDGYAALIRVTRRLEGGDVPSPGEVAALETFEAALKEAVEKDAAAILALAGIGRGKATYLVYARDGLRTAELVKGLSGDAEIKVSDDPAWTEAPAAIRAHVQ
jgi:hypothetical protein